MIRATPPPFAAAILGLTVTGLTVSGGAWADTPDAIAADAGCTACHAKDKRILGPSFSEIAGKYKGDPKAAAALAAKVRSGGKGVWGATPMPPADAETISDANLRTVIGWILKP